MNVYAEQVKKARRSRRWYAAVLVVLAAMTVLSVNWTLRQRGLSMTREYICGLAEHQHTEDCYTQELICTQEEGDEHQHMEDCYAQTLTCGLPEHVHTAECLAEEPDAHSGGDTPAVQTAETNMSEVDGCSITMSGSGTEYDAKGNLYKTELELDFKISAEAVQNNKGYYYDYPEGIIVPDGLLKGSYGLLDKGGKTVGTYSFTQNDDGTYRVHVDFDAEFDPDKDPVNGYVRFKGEVDGSQGDASGRGVRPGGTAPSVLQPVGRPPGGGQRGAGHEAVGGYPPGPERRDGGGGTGEDDHHRRTGVYWLSVDPCRGTEAACFGPVER